MHSMRMRTGVRAARRGSAERAHLLGLGLGVLPEPLEHRGARLVGGVLERAHARHLRRGALLEGAERARERLVLVELHLGLDLLDGGQGEGEGEGEG